MKKKKKDNRLLCYIGLVILIILLLLPPLLRLFGKNLYIKEEKKKDEVIVLTCNKQNESISSTFLNGEPQNIDYRIRGDYSVKIDEESDVNKREETNQIVLINLVKPYAQIEYDEKENRTIFRVKVNDLKGLKDYAVLFSNLDKQLNYYNSQAFYCEKITY